MTNQAAQTMPELPEPSMTAFTKADGMTPFWHYDGVPLVREGRRPDSDKNKAIYLYTANQVHQYARDYAAALSQTAGVADGVRVCKWHQQDEGYDTFSTGCGHEYTVNECTDGNVQLPYCPFCAKPLIGIAWNEDDDVSLSEALSSSAAAPAASGGEVKPESSPQQCRERLMREGKPYPRSGCDVCKTGGMTGCPYEKAVHAPQPTASASQSSNPNPVTPGLSSESAASVSERARALLAAEYRAAGFNAAADWIAEADLDAEENDLDKCVIRALEQALTQQRGSEPCLYVKPRLVEILHKLGPAQTEHRVMVSTVPDAQYTVCLSTTPQPGAEALRELVAEWKARPGVTDAYKICAEELESLLGRGGK